MSKTYTEEEETRILELVEQIDKQLMDLGKPIAELFEKCYGGQYPGEMSKMLQYLLMAQQQLINAEIERGWERNRVTPPWEGESSGVVD